VTEPTDMRELTGDLRAAVIGAAEVIIGREKAESFLEHTLRDALAERLPAASTEQRLPPALWGQRLGGVDVVYQPHNSSLPVGVETKVWEVADSLYDLFKLAAATQEAVLSAGYVVVAARVRDWQVPSLIRDMSETAREVLIDWHTDELLRADSGNWSRIWRRTAVLPKALPARLRTLAAVPVAMPLVADHEIRLIGVQAVGTECVALNPNGEPAGPRKGSADRPSDQARATCGGNR
jgi:hypothetical protein